MATQQTIAQLETALQHLESIDRQKLFRPSLGEESLQSELEPKLKEGERSIGNATKNPGPCLIG